MRDARNYGECVKKYEVRVKFFFRNQASNTSTVIKSNEKGKKWLGASSRFPILKYIFLSNRKRDISVGTGGSKLYVSFLLAKRKCQLYQCL